jgi:hypothetical protein
MLDRARQIDPPFASDDETSADWIPRSHPVPSDYVAFVRSMPNYIVAGDATTAEVAHRHARVVGYKVVASPGSANKSCNTRPGECFAPPSGVRFDVWYLPVGTAVTAYLLEGPRPILIEAAAPDATRLAQMTPSLDALLDSLDIA